MKHKFILFALIASVVILFSFCRKNEERLPLVTTSAVSAEINTAHCVGVLYSEGDAKVTEKGICWGTDEGVTISNNKVVCETDEQTFTAKITGLEPNTKYYAKAYAFNEFGVSYGKVVFFTTLSVDFPALDLYMYTSPTSNSLTLAMRLSQNKPFTFTTGICWSKSPMPTVLNSTVQISERKYTDLIPFGQTYISEIKDLDEATMYYARAFASSVHGVLYSNQITWTTPISVNPLSLSMISVGHTSALCAVSVTGMDMSQVKSTGVCWSESSMPTVSDYKQENPSATGNISIQTLQPNTTYYFRAYITTNTKTIYGPDEKVIRTFKSTMTDINGNEYNTVEIGGQEWMASNFKASAFNNGTIIPLIKPNTNYNQWVNNVNASVPVYCYYGDNATNNTTYGKLYPKYVAQNPNFPPAGWRLPTASDWENLVANASILDLCINNGSWSGSSGITNASGFSAYAAGFWDSGFAGERTQSRFWVAALTSSIYEDNTFHFTSYAAGQITWFQSGDAQSVRFIKE